VDNAPQLLKLSRHAPRPSPDAIARVVLHACLTPRL
jgi:hypothetical protein